VALTGFLNLSVLSSTKGLPVLFHTGTTLGVLPFRAFPRVEAGPSSQRSVPSCLFDQMTVDVNQVQPQGSLSKTALVVEAFWSTQPSEDGSKVLGNDTIRFPHTED
jgi:hypothetical protein